MDYSKMFEYRPFDIWDTDPYIEMCYNLTCEKLEKMYPNKKLFSSDCFGVSIIDDMSDSFTEIASYTTGRLGKAGPLAMRNELTKEVNVLTIRNIVSLTN